MINDKYKLKKDEILSTVLSIVGMFICICGISYLFHIMGNDLSWGRIAGFFGIIALLVAVFGIYLVFADVEILRDKKKLVAMCVLMALSLAVYMAIQKFFSPFAVPYAFCALICGLVISRKSGFISSLIVVLIMFCSQTFFSGLAPNDYVTLCVGICSTILASYTLSRQTKRIRYIGVAFILALLTCLMTCIILFVSAEEADYLNAVVYSLLSGFISVAFFMLVVPVLDSVFNFVTDFRLAELTSTDAPLIKKLFKEAPGTFNHCLSVSNYTEACASAIGTNTYLARAAAFYHDIGKMKNPQYFTENQLDGHNPHDEITPELSTAIIKKHVSNGVLMVKENHLPQLFTTFITEHHGTMPIQFFYSKAQKYTDGTLEDTGFRYDGPTPSNKISAILMICDASEATLRALNVETREQAEQIVGNIINERLIKYGQFDNCDITMQELNVIKQTIVTVYLGVCHKRITYPGQQKNK